LKDDIKNYIKNNQLFTSFFTVNGMNAYVDGMLIIDNPNVGENEAYVFDSQKATVYSRPGVGIEFAYENRANFEDEMVTVKVYERLNMLVRNVDKNAFLHLSDLASDIAGINKP